MSLDIPNTETDSSSYQNVRARMHFDFLVLIHIYLFGNLVFYMGEMAQESPPIELEFL